MREEMHHKSSLGSIPLRRITGVPVTVEGTGLVGREPDSTRYHGESPVVVHKDITNSQWLDLCGTLSCWSLQHLLGPRGPVRFLVVDSLTSLYVSSVLYSKGQRFHNLCL